MAGGKQLDSGKHDWEALPFQQAHRASDGKGLCVSMAKWEQFAYSSLAFAAQSGGRSYSTSRRYQFMVALVVRMCWGRAQSKHGPTARLDPCVQQTQRAAEVSTAGP